MAKIALLIGVSEYEPGLEPLPSAVKDIAAVQQVLANPEMGGFDAAHITLLPNPSRQTMEDAIYTLFANRQKDDLVLLYFSGHGIVDDNGEFYFATRFTRKDQGRLVPPTAVAAQSVQRWMEDSRSQHQVIILDSCFSGAFARGVKAKDSGSVNLEQHLGGKGRAILTASTSTQYALAQDGFDLSIYTHYLVEGIRTGGADQDDDGFIGVEELHAYTSSKVKEAAPAMTPEFYPVKEGYKILLAKSPKDDPELKYRKAVKLLATEDEGDFSFINRAYLDDLQRNLGLSTENATLVETEELEPYRQRKAKVERYRTVFSQAVAQRYPLNDRDRIALQRLQQLLSLRDEDIAAIETPILAPRKLEYDRQQAEQRQREQIEQRQRAMERAAQRQQQPIVSPKVEPDNPPSVTPPSTSAPNSNVPIQSFEFETATLTVVKKPGWFGGKTAIEISRSRRQGKQFVESSGNAFVIEMVVIPAGEFLMGSPNNQGVESERPQHRVTIPVFYMGKFPVTQAQYEAVMGTNPAAFKGANRPVENVSWEDAMEFCAQLSCLTGKFYRLPSEAEWEYACRAGTTTPFHFGETLTTDLANYDGNYTYGKGVKGTHRQQTTDVGSFPANTFGLYDMHGNVWEWCADYWHDNYNGAPTDGSAWTTDGNSKNRIIRGGSWNYGPLRCRAVNRNSHSPDGYYFSPGFRVVCSVFPRLF